MILTPSKTIEHYRQGGLWGRVTLDTLFRRTAASHPDRLAIVDAPDRTAWTSGMPRRMTYAQADAEIDLLAGFFTTVGLSTDHVIGLQAPNTTDTVIAFLAALRAGLIVAPLPLHWRQKDVLAALNRAGAKALIAGDRLEKRPLGDEARQTAGEMFSLRFVFGLGREVPDGLIEIAKVLDEAGDEFAAPSVTREGNAADHVATLTWTRSTGGEPLPVARSHNHWIAAGLMPYLESGLSEGADHIVPYGLSGMVGIGAGLVPWLLSGGTLHLHHPAALRRLADHAGAVEADYVLCPGSLTPELDRRMPSGGGIVSVWSITAPPPLPHSTNRRHVDLHVADEFAMVARARGGSALPALIPTGPVGAPTTIAQAPALVEIAIDDEASPNTLKVRGPMVADSAWPACNVRIPTDKAGYIDTLLPVRRNESGIIGFGIPGAGAPGVSSLAALDALFGSFPGLTEAAGFFVEDGVLGARLYAAVVPQPGAIADIDAFYGFLDAERVSLAEIPHKVISLNRLPRTEAGRIDRAALASKVQRLLSAVA